MEAVVSPEISVNFYQPTLRHFPADSNGYSLQADKILGETLRSIGFKRKMRTADSHDFVYVLVLA
jgi:hypothetical protein